ncbi:MAG: MFS transporter [Theionarchaea archaeon]|nr:MFS transporter [Theionarchaea archaeon]
MSAKGFTKGITLNILILGLVSLFTDLSSQMVFPLIPLFLTSVLGAGGTIVGFVEGAAETAASLLKVFSGYWSDKIGRRKPFVLIGYGLSSLMKPLFAFSSVWEVVFGIRIVERIGKGIRTAPRDVIIADSSDAKVRGKAYGIHRFMDGIGSVFGALLAFVLLPLLGFRKVFLVAFIPAAIAVVLILFVKEKTQRSAPIKPESLEISMKALTPSLKYFIAIATLFTLGHFGYPFLLLRALNLGFKNETAILLYVLYYVVYSVFIIPAGAVSDKIKRKYVILTGYGLFAVTSLGLVFASSLSQIVWLFVLYGGFYAMIDGVQRAYVVDLSPPHIRGTALGTFHTSVGLAALPAGLIAGLLWDIICPEMTFVFGCLLSVTAVVLLLSLEEKTYDDFRGEKR